MQKRMYEGEIEPVDGLQCCLKQVQVNKPPLTLSFFKEMPCNANVLNEGNLVKRLLQLVRVDLLQKETLKESLKSGRELDIKCDVNWVYKNKNLHFLS